MATGEQPGVRSFMHEAIAAVPAIWVGVIVVLSARGILRSFPTAFVGDLPVEIATYVHVAMAISLAQIVFGVFVFRLAWRRSPRFAHWFTLWAVFVICCDLGLQAATLFMNVFTQTVEPWLMIGLFTAIGIAAIFIARRADTPPAATVSSATTPASAGIMVLHGFLGFIGGGGLGLVLGFGVGALTVEALDVSCFEGGCGYATVAIAFLIMIAGAIAGLVVAVRRARRKAAS